MNEVDGSQSSNRGKGEDPLVRHRLLRILIPRALRVRNKIQQPRGFMLHIVLNEDQLKWDPLFESASYANTRFEKYILKKILKTQSLK